MIIPDYWAEGRLQHRRDGKQITVRRFGWSDLSQADAQANADARARDALQGLLAGQKLPRRELKQSYNGAEGLPIREEVLSRHGSAVITRNAYGARCLNTPNVMFVDIDFPDGPGLRFMALTFLWLVTIAAILGWYTHSTLAGLITVVFAAIFIPPISSTLHWIFQRVQGGQARIVKQRILRFIAQHPEWSLRLYETPAGRRVLVTHRCFEPADPTVKACFEALGADKVYVSMCLNQQCFRARLSAKPWRIGIGQHLRPNPGVWPVRDEHLPLRREWVQRYEKAAAGYSSCRYLETIGSNNIHIDARPVMALHDELCRAVSSLPLA